MLVFNNNIGGIIICKSPTNYDTRSYCRLVSDSFVGKEDGGWDSTLLYPATKEQRDTLFKAMADAGYTFDFEKKELENIEQKSVWSEEDEMIEKVTNYLNSKLYDWVQISHFGRREYPDTIMKRDFIYDLKQAMKDE